jgi:hypothetical protein
LFAHRNVKSEGPNDDIIGLLREIYAVEILHNKNEEEDRELGLNFLKEVAYKCEDAARFVKENDE